MIVKSRDRVESLNGICFSRFFRTENSVSSFSSSAVSSPNQLGIGNSYQPSSSGQVGSAVSSPNQLGIANSYQPSSPGQVGSAVSSFNQPGIANSYQPSSPLQLGSAVSSFNQLGIGNSYQPSSSGQQLTSAANRIVPGSYAVQSQASKSQQITLLDNNAPPSYQSVASLSSSLSENQYGDSLSGQNEPLILDNAVSTSSSGTFNLNPPIQYYVNEPMVTHSDLVKNLLGPDDTKSLNSFGDKTKSKPVVVQRFRDSQLKFNLAADSAVESPSRGQKLSVDPHRGQKLSDGNFVINLSGVEEHNPADLSSSLHLTTSQKATVPFDSSTLFLDGGGLFADQGLNLFNFGEFYIDILPVLLKKHFLTLLHLF